MAVRTVTPVPPPELPPIQATSRYKWVMLNISPPPPQPVAPFTPRNQGG